ncbi:claudin-1 [Esox lucius]|uniref:Claudin n=1 Tax=Esox lucius TaxID=8010 RepID=A0AAY5L6X9_ESOLU|nr:claudin-1 [Esox lucius]
MANSGMQLLGFTLAFFGFIGMIVSTVMAEWKISSYAGDNIITAQAVYEGLWMSCVSQSTGQIQCKVYDSMLQLPGMVVATRGLMVGAIFLCGLAILVSMVGLKCMVCLAEQPDAKGKVAMTGGIVFIIAGLCALVGTSWYGSRIAKEFYDPFTPTNSRYEFGKALFIGWASASLTIIGGSILSCSCPGKASGTSPRYPATRSTAPPGKDYV